MADPTVTRDILRGALNKHIDNDNTDAFEQVITALGGLEKEVERGDSIDEAKELRRTARHAALDPQAFGAVIWRKEPWEAAHPVRKARRRRSS